MTDAEGTRASSARTLLRSTGLRITAGRLAALEALDGHAHLTVDELHRSIAPTAAMTVQAVYLLVQTLTEHGVLRRIEPAGSPARYELRVGDNHHHLVCERCACIVDVDCDSDVVPCLIPSAGHGFTVREAEVTFWGICPDCAATTAGQHEPSGEGAR